MAECDRPNSLRRSRRRADVMRFSSEAFKHTPTVWTLDGSYREDAIFRPVLSAGLTSSLRIRLGAVISRSGAHVCYRGQSAVTLYRGRWIGGPETRSCAATRQLVGLDRVRITSEQTRREWPASGTWVCRRRGSSDVRGTDIRGSDDRSWWRGRVARVCVFVACLHKAGTASTARKGPCRQL